jgi:hypothetical protein
MTAPFVIWDATKLKDSVLLHKLEKVPRKFELVEGVSRATAWPAEAVYLTNPDYRKDRGLPDNLMNTDRLVVVSTKLRAFLEGRGVSAVEYLPVTILDHKAKELSRDYAIANPLDSLDCFDQERSVFQWSQSTPGLVQEVKKLAIDASKVPPERQVFRTKSFPDCVIVRRELAAAVDAAGFTGLGWIELDAYSTY